MRTLVGVFSWTLYSDHDGLSLLMHKWPVWRGDTMREEYRLSLRSSLWDLQYAVGLINLSSINFVRQDYGGKDSSAKVEHNISFRKVYKQTIFPYRCFHFLHGCDWHRIYSSESFAPAFVARFD